MPKVSHQEGKMDVRGHGLELMISSSRDVPPDEVTETVIEIMKSISKEVMYEGAVAIGHIKSYLKAKSGFVKSDTVGIKYGVNVYSELTEPVRTASLVLNIIVVGLDLKKIKKIALDNTIKVLAKHGFDSTIANKKSNHKGIYERHAH
jgi:hypothetical protein